MKDKRQRTRAGEQAPDSYFRQRLERLEAPFSPGSWAPLEQRLDEEDRIAAGWSSLERKAAAVTVSYDGSWALFEARLEQYTRRRRTVLGSKAAEVLLLLALLVWWYPGSQADSLREEEPVTTVVRVEATETPVDPSGPVVSTTTPAAGSEPGRAKTETGPVAGQGDAPAGKEWTRAEGRRKASVRSADRIATGRKRPVTSPEKATNTQRAASATIVPLSAVSPPPALVSANGSTTVLSAAEGLAPVERVSPVTPLPVLSFVPDAHQEDPLGRIRKPRQSFKTTNIWLAFAFTHDRDLVKSPYPDQLSSTFLGRIESNIHASVFLFFEHRFAEIQTGISWMNKDYESVYEGRNDVRILSVPMQVRLKMKPVGPVRGYILGGISANFVAYANYAENDLFKRRPELSLIENNYRLHNYSLFSSSSFRHGILEGESIRGNQYYTVNMGIGVEARFAGRYAFFLEQSYYHHLTDDAVGPAFDRFYSTSTTMGIRCLMNRR